ncbi:Bacteriophage protein [Mycobacteroides abscessus subsp. massiliense]|nr:Ig-like domain-containing protein [Mycobacteroides abscessus]SKM17534.1 Bacteriophage protein [Mycobacteroides abscessus subsp. massiliense]MDM2426934.1 Ig-like domain-containing protein [Mycobacteroides abscessus]MDM2431736.1 Ig-like domain-containing protein [Mycobacteroides abscessus]MDM2436651.1 Ig-like domain-containing protein [Mycobacteroides abscessus]
MANAFVKPNVIINTVLGMLQGELVLPHFVWKDGLGDFAGKYNDTITIRIPQPTIAHSRALRAVGSARNMTVSDLTETTIDVKLTDVVYNLVALTDEERELDLRSFATDVLPRQVRAVSSDLEFGVSETIRTAPYTEVHSVAGDAIWNGVIAARRQLNEAHVPVEGRVLLIGSAVEEALLLDNRFVRYDSAGQAGASRLVNATIGRLAGYDVVVVDTIPHGAAYLFHPTAFVMVTRAPGRPISNTVAVSSVGSENGVALRWLGDYDSSLTTDRSLVDTWVGYKAVVDPDPGFVRAARIQLKATSVTIGNEGALTAAAGANHTRQLTLIDSNGDDRADDATSWVSSDQTKATVVDGLLTGVAAGSTTITATVDGVSDTYAVTVS